MHRVLSYCALTVLAVAIAACGGGGRLNPPGRGFNSGGNIVETAQTTVTVTPGPPIAAAVTWSTAFTDTNYTAVCTPKLVSGGNSDLTVVILSKSITGLQTLVQFDDNGTVQVNCIAVADGTTSDLRHTRATFNSPGRNETSTQSLIWNTAFPDTVYTAVCSIVATIEVVPVTEHLHSTTQSQVTTTVNYVTSTVKPFEVDCIGVAGATTSGVRPGLLAVSQTLGVPLSVTLNWATPFTDSNYVPVCDTLFVSGTESTITTNADGTTATSQTAVLHWNTTDGTAVVGCFAAEPSPMQ